MIIMNLKGYAHQVRREVFQNAKMKCLKDEIGELFDELTQERTKN